MKIDTPKIANLTTNGYLVTVGGDGTLAVVSALAAAGLQSNRIDADLTIPTGYTVAMFGPFEVGPDVVVEGEGNACFRGL